MQFDDITGADALEQLLDILIAQANAAVRLRVADRLRLVGAVDSVALGAQSDPARANRIRSAGNDDGARLVVGGIRDAVTMLNVPTGLGETGAPTATGYMRTISPFSINASLWSGMLTTMRRVAGVVAGRGASAAIEGFANRAAATSSPGSGWCASFPCRPPLLRRRRSNGASKR